MDRAFAEIDFRAVAKVAQRASLRDLWLAWSQAGVFVPREAIGEDWQRKATGWYASELLIDESEDLSTPFEVGCSFKVRYTVGQDGGENVVSTASDSDENFSLAVEAAFVLKYEVQDTDGLIRSDLEHFATANATHNAWPYWREFAQSMTTRIGIAPYVAPPFKLPSRDDPKSTAASDAEE